MPFQFVDDDRQLIQPLLTRLALIVTIHGVRASYVPRGSDMTPPPLDEHLLHLSVS
jgi:hypothetical protein